MSFLHDFFKNNCLESHFSGDCRPLELGVGMIKLEGLFFWAWFH